MMKRHYPTLIGVVAGLLGAVLVVMLVYRLIDFIPATITDSNLTARGIDNETKMWLNGYLGVFFRFKTSGNINWLMIPLALFYVMQYKKRDKWEVALLVFQLMAFGLIAVQGYFNYRYAMTIWPLTTVITLVLIWRIFDSARLQPFRHLVMVFCVGLTAFNTYHYLLGSGDVNPNEIIADVAEVPVDDQVVQPAQKTIPGKGDFLQAALGIDMPGFDDRPDLFLPQYKFPYSAINFAQSLPLKEGRRIMVHGLYAVNYYSDLPVVIYWAEDDFAYTADGPVQVLKNRDVAAQIQFIKSELKCDYLMTTQRYNSYVEDFNNLLLSEKMTLLYRDPGGYEVYRIND